MDNFINIFTSWQFLELVEIFLFIVIVAGTLKVIDYTFDDKKSAKKKRGK